MTYSQKLKDPRWAEFRAEFIRYKQAKFPEDGSMCDDCGEDTKGSLHAHHKLYRPGTEPWDYDFDDLRLLCASCHRRIHEIENRVRQFVLTLHPHETYEFEDLLLEFIGAQAFGMTKIALARAKSAARYVVDGKRYPRVDGSS